MVDGDIEQPPLIYQPNREHHRLRLRAQVEGGPWEQERLDEVAELVRGILLQSLARSALVSTVECSHERHRTDQEQVDPDLIGVGATIRVKEPQAHAVANEARQQLAKLPGIKDEIGAVSWRLSVPRAMARAQRRP